MKRFLSFLLAFILFLAGSCSAFADGILSSLFESVQTLLFATGNVTLSGNAVFSLNGERFKTAEILYKQDRENSHWQLDLLTPRSFRPEQETGYTVIANGEKLYVMERYYPGVYKTGSDQPSSTLIRQSTHSDLLFSLLLSLADQMETLLPAGSLTEKETSEGRELQIALSEDTVPDIVNTSLNLVADFILRRFMGVNYDNVRKWGQSSFDNYPTVTQAILYSTDHFVLGDTFITVRSDAGGRLTGASGSVTALLCSEELNKTPLDIVFSLSVSDYGTTFVKAFDPNDFHVVLAGSGEKPAKDVDPSLSEQLTSLAAGLLTAAGYDPAALPPVHVLDLDGLCNVIYQNPDSPAAITVVFDEDGRLVSIADGWNAYDMSDPHEPSQTSLPPETCKALSAFLQEADPDHAAMLKDFIPILEYTWEGVNYLYVCPLKEDGTEAALSLVIRTEPALQVVRYICMDE